MVNSSPIGRSWFPDLDSKSCFTRVCPQPLKRIFQPATTPSSPTQQNTLNLLPTLPRLSQHTSQAASIMAMPGSISNPAREARDIQDEKLREAYVQGHDADTLSEDPFSKDVEKGTESHAHSMLAEERTQYDIQSKDPSIHRAEEEPRDPNIVDWEGPDDPANPQSCMTNPNSGSPPRSNLILIFIHLGTKKKKWGIIAALGATTLITPLASSFFAPGVPQVLRSFHETSNLLAAFVVSIYILG